MTARTRFVGGGALAAFAFLSGCGGNNSGPTPNPTNTPSPTAQPTSTANPNATSTPRPTATARPTASPRPTATANPNATATPRPTANPNATATPRPTATARPTAVPTARPTATPRPTAVPTPRPTATARPTLTPRPTPTATPAPAAPIFFDFFLFDNAGQPANDFNGFIQWNVTGGTVDLLGGRIPGATDQTNGRFVDLDGGDSGRFASRLAIPFVGGQTYNLSFSYKSTDGQSNTAAVAIGSQRFTVSTSSTTLQRFSRNFRFATTTTANLVFQDLGNDDNGLGIDDITVSPQP